MFDKQYDFYGNYATYVEALSQGNKSDDQIYPFRYHWQVYLVAPIIGFQYKRQAICVDKTKSTSVFAEQIINHSSLFKFTYQLIMLLDESYEKDFEKRIEKAFKIIGSPEAKEDELHYDKYVLGGVEYLYNMLIEKGGTTSLFSNIMELLKEYNSTYNEKNELSLAQLFKSLKN